MVERRTFGDVGKAHIGAFYCAALLQGLTDALVGFTAQITETPTIAGIFAASAVPPSVQSSIEPLAPIADAQSEAAQREALREAQREQAAQRQREEAPSESVQHEDGPRDDAARDEAPRDDGQSEDGPRDDAEREGVPSEDGPSEDGPSEGDAREEAVQREEARFQNQEAAQGLIQMSKTLSVRAQRQQGWKFHEEVQKLSTQTRLRIKTDRYGPSTEASAKRPRKDSDDCGQRLDCPPIVSSFESFQPVATETKGAYCGRVPKDCAWDVDKGAYVNLITGEVHVKGQRSRR